MKSLCILVACVLLASCGGGSGSDLSAYLQAVELAKTKEVEARALAVDTPCDTAAQCALLSYTDPASQCVFPAYQAYSLLSPTAVAAKTASDQQLALAAHARELYSGPIVPCPAYAIVVPTLACVASHCQKAP